MPSFFLDEIQPSATLRISSQAKKLKMEGKDVISLSAGEPDIPPPDCIKEYVQEAFKKHFTKYTPASGMPELRQKVSQILLEENKVEYNWEQIIITPGAKFAIFSALFSILEKTDEVIIISPYWVSYLPMVQLCKAKAVILSTDIKNDFEISLKEVENKITPKTKAIIINSPSNPTGKILSVDFLKGLLNLALERNIYIISDEIYQKIIFDSHQHTSIASLHPKGTSIVITVDGVSKCLSIPGLRIGWACAPLQVSQRISKLQSHTISSPTSICQYAVLKTLSSPYRKEFISYIKTAFEKRRDMFCNYLSQIEGFNFFKPQGAFYVFVDISKICGDSQKFCTQLLNQKFVSAVPGVSFGKEGFIRLSFCENENRLKEALLRIEDFVKNAQF